MCIDVGDIVLATGLTDNGKELLGTNDSYYNVVQVIPGHRDSYILSSRKRKSKQIRVWPGRGDIQIAKTPALPTSGKVTTGF